MQSAAINKVFDFLPRKNCAVGDLWLFVEPMADAMKSMLCCLLLVLFCIGSASSHANNPPQGRLVASFSYNAEGLRIEKQGERGIERYTYDDQSVLSQRDGSNALVARYTYGPNRLISLEHKTEGTQFYLTDALNSIVNLMTTNGLVQARYQYDAFGNKRSESGSSWNRFAFTGYEEDKETNLLYAKARYYDADTGRFLSQDPWHGENSTPPSLNKYLYAYQNPTVYIDPDGRESVTQMIDRGAEGCNAFTCAGWAATQAGYQVATLGFAAVHDPVREAYDSEKIAGGEYIAKGIGGGAVVAGVSLVTGRLATPFLLGAQTIKATVAVGATVGAIDGVATDAITQGVHISAGIQSEYDVGRTEKAAALGAVIGSGAAGSSKYLNNRAKSNIAVESHGGPMTNTVDESLAAKGDAGSIPKELQDDLDRGGSYLISEENYKKYSVESALSEGRPIGRPDGQFITSAIEMNKAINDTGGNSVKLGEKFGMNVAEGEALIRMDIDHPNSMNPRLPDSSLSGANDKFISGGKTSGGIPEVVIDPIPADKAWPTKVEPF